MCSVVLHTTKQYISVSNYSCISNELFNEDLTTQNNDKQRYTTTIYKETGRATINYIQLFHKHTL